MNTDHLLTDEVHDCSGQRLCDCCRSLQLAPRRVLEPRMPLPDWYSGEPGSCHTLLTQCSLLFNLHSPPSTPVTYFITLLAGKAHAWGMAFWPLPPSCPALPRWSRSFDQTSVGHSAARYLLRLCQEQQSVSEFYIEFRTSADMVTSVGWIKEAL